MLTLVRHVQRHDESVVVSQMSSLHTLHFLRPVGPGAHVQAAKSLAWKLLPKMPAIPLVDENVAPHFALMCTHTPNVSVRPPLMLLCHTCQAQTSTKRARAAHFQQQHSIVRTW